MTKIIFDLDRTLRPYSAEPVEEIFRGHLTSEENGLFEIVRKDVLREPHKYNWIYQKIPTAYADEGHFEQKYAIIQEFFKRHPEVKDSLTSPGKDFAYYTEDQLIDEIYKQASATCFGKIPEENKQTLSELVNQGHTVKILTNSSSVMEELPRGVTMEEGAMKHVVNPHYEEHTIPSSVFFQGRTIHLRRPYYHEALIREQPDYVVGDIISFDIALVQYLRQRGVINTVPILKLDEDFKTPQWAIDYCKHYNIKTIKNISELPDLLNSPN